MNILTEYCDLKITTWINHTLHISININASILDLKKDIGHIYGTTIESQKLSYNNFYLQDTDIICNVIIDKKINLNLTLKDNHVAILRVFCPLGQNIDNRRELYIFDMDDTLTKNMILIEGVERQLINLRKTHNLAVASYNRSCVEILRMNNIDHLFDVIVCGYSPTITKMTHIKHIQRFINKYDKCFFYDDQYDNVRHVRHQLNNVQVFWVTESRPLTYHLKHYHPNYLPLINTKYL
jgi:hypothetical protein